MRMENPTTVHRVWAGLSDAELLMATTYHQMAHKFCAAQIEDEPDGCALVYVDHYTGKMEIFRKAPVEVTQ